MKQRIPILIVSAALIVGGAYVYPRFTKESKPSNELVLSGNIEAHESLVSFKVQGRIVELPVEEGESIQAGALLARLDTDDYKQRVLIDEASVRVRQSNLALSLAGTREQEIKAAQQTMLDAQADMQQRNSTMTVRSACSTPDASSHGRSRCVAPEGRAGLLPIPRCSREHDSAAHLQTSRMQAMAVPESWV
jgi:HlyD family secretion protein